MRPSPKELLGVSVCKVLIALSDSDLFRLQETRSTVAKEELWREPFSFNAILTR
jgi:hypothetical protein